MTADEMVSGAVAATQAAADEAPVRKEFDPETYLPVKAAELSALLRSLSRQAEVIAAQGRALERIAEHLGVDLD